MANAGTIGFALRLPGVDPTLVALPTWVPLTLRVTLPLGPAPLLLVLTLTVMVTGLPIVALAGEKLMVVVAFVTVMAVGVEVFELALKLLSPE